MANFKPYNEEGLIQLKNFSKAYATKKNRSKKLSSKEVDKRHKIADLQLGTKAQTAIADDMILDGSDCVFLRTDPNHKLLFVSSRLGGTKSLTFQIRVYRNSKHTDLDNYEAVEKVSIFKNRLKQGGLDDLYFSIRTKKEQHDLVIEQFDYIPPQLKNVPTRTAMEVAAANQSLYCETLLSLCELEKRTGGVKVVRINDNIVWPPDKYKGLVRGRTNAKYDKQIDKNPHCGLLAFFSFFSAFGKVVAPHNSAMASSAAEPHPRGLFNFRFTDASELILNLDRNYIYRHDSIPVLPQRAFDLMQKQFNEVKESKMQSAKQAEANDDESDDSHGEENNHRIQEEVDDFDDIIYVTEDEWEKDSVSEDGSERDVALKGGSEKDAAAEAEAEKDAAAEGESEEDSSSEDESEEDASSKDGSEEDAAAKAEAEKDAAAEVRSEEDPSSSSEDESEKDSSSEDESEEDAAAEDKEIKGTRKKRRLNNFA